MFLTADHMLWLAAGEVFLYLLLFAAFVSMIIFFLRGPLRQYKTADLLVFKKLERWNSERNNRIMLAITFLGKHQFLIPANLLLMGLMLLFGWHYWWAFRIFIVSLSSLSLMFILKHLFHRKRPLTPLLYEAKGKSFPSGHAIMSVNFFGLLLYMLWQTEVDLFIKIIVSVITIFLIIAIGFSRIYLRVHYTSDVLAGFIIGLGWFYTVLLILGRLEALLK